MKAKTYFITGGLGFIGAHFVHYLHNISLRQESWLLIKKPMQPTPNELLSS